MISVLIISIDQPEKLLPQIDQIKESLSDWIENVDYQIVMHCQNQSASLNRNAAYEKSKGNYVIFNDNDISNYPKDWAFKLCAPLNETIKIISARLMTPNGTPGVMISFRGDIDTTHDVWIGNDYLLPSACFAFKRETLEAVKNCQELPDNLPFDINYERAVAEDADLCASVKKLYPDMKIAVHNKVPVQHENLEIWRSGGFKWEKNHQRFHDKWGRPPH